MSTRCQVQVIQEGLEWKQKVTLYHHADGYPEYMLPLIWGAFNYKRLNYADKLVSCDWEKGRAGKVAGLLCYVDPLIFEPESGHGLHGDIEYLYRLYCINSYSGSTQEKANWEVEILVPNKGFRDNPKASNMTVQLKRTPIQKAIKEDK